MAVLRVTVFGGAGFIGRHLVKRLADKGYIVCVVTRNIEAAAFLKTLGEPGQIVIRLADITNQKQVEALVTRSDKIVNLVGILYERGKHTLEQLHVEVPRLLARLCKAANIKDFVHVSALGASETSRARYSRSKAIGELAVRDSFSSTIILRPSVVFGPEDNFFNRFASLASLSPFLPLFTSASTRDTGPSFQPVYVGDVADAIVHVLNSKDCHGRLYELGGPKIYTMRDILEMVLREIDRRRLIVPVPFWIGMLKASILQYLPKPPLTPDQIILLQYNNVLSGAELGFEALSINPTAPEAIIPTYLDRYRRSSHFLRYIV